MNGRMLGNARSDDSSQSGDKKRNVLSIALVDNAHRSDGVKMQHFSDSIWISEEEDSWGKMGKEIGVARGLSRR